MSINLVWGPLEEPNLHWVFWSSLQHSVVVSPAAIGHLTWLVQVFFVCCSSNTLSCPGSSLMNLSSFDVPFVWSVHLLYVSFEVHFLWSFNVLSFFFDVSFLWSFFFSGKNICNLCLWWLHNYGATRVEYAILCTGSDFVAAPGGLTPRASLCATNLLETPRSV